MLSKISLHQSGKEIKLGQGDGLTNRRTFLSICLRKAPVIFSKDYDMKNKRDKAYEKIQEELDILISEIKNKVIGLRSQPLNREVAKTNQKKSAQYLF